MRNITYIITATTKNYLFMNKTSKDTLKEPTSLRQASILLAATKVFEMHGYSATTMDAVAAEANVAKGSLYNYFPSKQKLFEAVFDASFTEDEAVIDALVAAPISAVEKIGLYVDHWFSRLEHCKKIGGLILEFWAHATRAQAGDETAIFQEVHNRWHNRIRDIIHQGIADGDFRDEIDANNAAIMVLAMIDGMTIHAIMNAGIKIDANLSNKIKLGLLTSLGSSKNVKDL